MRGEGTPLPIGATCLAYHVGRIWAGVGNVVYGSSGPDAVASGSSGNAGFDLAFTCQSKVIRFWVTPMGLIIFTLRDAYIITGDGAPTQLGGTPFVFKTFIENLPLLNYNAFGINFSTAYMLSGHKMVYSLDPSAGILEASFPIATRSRRSTRRPPMQRTTTAPAARTRSTCRTVRPCGIGWPPHQCPNRARTGTPRPISRRAVVPCNRPKPHPAP